MSTLRQLFEEALGEGRKAKAEKGGEASLKKGQLMHRRYSAELKDGGQWPGGNIHHDEFGKFSDLPNSTSVSWGSKSLAKDGRDPGGSYGLKVKKGDQAGRMSGTAKRAVYSKNGRGDPYTPKESNPPVKDRVVLRTGATRANSKRLGSRKDRLKQIANLVLGRTGTKAKRAEWVKGQLKKNPTRGAGKTGSQAGAKVGAYEPAYIESAENLFLSRLMEGQETHPLEHVEFARNSMKEALDALISMPGAEDFDEIVESAEGLASIIDFLDYDEED